MNNKLTLIAYIDILPGFEEGVKKGMVTMVAEARKEPGCELFLTYTQSDAPQMIITYEVYESQEAFDFHRTTPYAATFFDFTKGKIKNDKIEVTFLTELQ